ncbi:MAG: TRAP transporter large permease subunit, partial [Oscillospiraceae bacterium]|nr:TRAP transporter large permease subunit [Oscillospiraceae bacterium]
MILALFIVLLILLIGSVPIFIGLIGSVSLSFAAFGDIDLVIIIQKMFAGINKFSLMSIPMFIFAANIMGRGGISKRI